MRLLLLLQFLVQLFNPVHVVLLVVVRDLILCLELIAVHIYIFDPLPTFRRDLYSCQLFKFMYHHDLILLPACSP